MDAYVKGKNVWTGKSPSRPSVSNGIIVGDLKGEFVKDNDPNSWKSKINKTTYNDDGGTTFSSYDVDFGRNESQVYHSFRYVDDYPGLTREAVQSAILNDLSDKASIIQPLTSYKDMPINVSGVSIKYSVWNFGNGSFKVGSIKPPIIR